MPKLSTLPECINPAPLSTRQSLPNDASPARISERAQRSLSFTEGEDRPYNRVTLSTKWMASLEQTISNTHEAPFPYAKAEQEIRFFFNNIQGKVERALAAQSTPKA